MRYKVNKLVKTEYGAEEHLHAIRRLMERATIYRAISAPTALTGGLLSTVTAAVMLNWQMREAGRNVNAVLFLEVWTLVFVLTLAANTLFIWRGAHVRGEPVVSSAMKLALRSIMPSLFAGAAIGACLTITTSLALLPPLFWVIFYGLGLLSTMNFAPRSMVLLGWAFLFTGIFVLIYLMNASVMPDFDLPSPTRFFPAALMGVTFGLYHVVYAACTWPRRNQVLDAIERRPLVATGHPPVL